MPVMDGLELYDTLKNDLNYKGKFILMSGGVSNKHEKYIDKVDSILIKPFNSSQLKDIIAKLYK